MTDIRLSDDVTKPTRPNDLGTVQDFMISGPNKGKLHIYWLDSEESTLENPDDLEVYTYGYQWTKKDAKADAKLRGLKLNDKTIVR